MGVDIRDERGITLVEVMVAAVVLLGGMLGIVGVLNRGLVTTSLTNQRVAATNLLRELTEAARGAVYADLTPTRIAAAVQRRNRDLAASGEWVIRKGGTTYTVTTSVCTYDDPADKIAASPPEGKCGDNPGGTTGDLNGDDFRRVSFDLSWSAQGRPKRVRQSTLINNPSGGLGPRIVAFEGPSATISSGTTASFNVTTTRAAAVRWNADDGVSTGTATGLTTPESTSWTLSWALKAPTAADAVLDGTYAVSAQAFDDRGIAGDSKVATVTIDRSLPFAPADLVGGHNTREAADPAGGDYDGSWVDLEWVPNRERDIVGYRVYWAGGNQVAGDGDDQLVCPASGTGTVPTTVHSCADLDPDMGAQRYYVVAVDANAEGARRTLDIPAAGAAPAPPQTLSVTGGSSAQLSWTAPASGAVRYYRVYRDGTTRAHRFTTATATGIVDEGDGNAHRYWVSAVDSAYNESSLVGPVDWSPTG